MSLPQIIAIQPEVIAPIEILSAVYSEEGRKKRYPEDINGLGGTLLFQYIAPTFVGWLLLSI